MRRLILFAALLLGGCISQSIVTIGRAPCIVVPTPTPAASSTPGQASAEALTLLSRCGSDGSQLQRLGLRKLAN